MEPIIVGHVGERGTRQHIFPIGNLIAKYPDCQPFVMHKRAGDTTAHPVVNAVVDGGRLVWTFSAVDTAVNGDGLCWLAMVSPDGETVWMTDKIRTITKDGYTDFESDDPWAVWIQSMLNLAAEVRSIEAEAKQDADKAAEWAGHAEQSAQDAADHADSARLTAEAVADKLDDAEARVQDARKAAQDSAKHAGESQMYATLAEMSAASHGFFRTYIDAQGHLHYVRTDGLADIDLKIMNGRLVMSYGVE